SPVVAWMRDAMSVTRSGRPILASLARGNPASSKPASWQHCQHRGRGSRLELEIHAREPRAIADRELATRAEAVDLGERQLGVDPGVLDAALLHRHRGRGIDALGAYRQADRARHTE